MSEELLFADAERNAEARWKDVVEAVANEARERAPLRRGTLRNSLLCLNEKTADGFRAVISFSAPHARYVHEGTGKYHPQGRRGRWVYAVTEEGSVRFFSTEGQPARPFLRQAMDHAAARLKEAFR